MCYNGVTVKINLTKYKQIQRWEVYLQTYWVEPPWFFFKVILVLTLTMIKKKAGIKAISVLIRTHLIIKTAE